MVIIKRALVRIFDSNIVYNEGVFLLNYLDPSDWAILLLVS